MEKLIIKLGSEDVSGPPQSTDDVQHQYQYQWHSGTAPNEHVSSTDNISDLYSQSSYLGHATNTFRGSSQSPLQEHTGIATQIRPQTLPSRSFPIQYYCTYHSTLQKYSRSDKQRH